jgi:hypothetical protein
MIKELLWSMLFATLFTLLSPIMAQAQPIGFIELFKSNSEGKIIYAVAFSPDNKTMASGGPKNSVMIWDSNSNKALAELVGHNGAINGLAYSRDGRFLASASSDKTVMLWDISSFQRLKTFTGHKYDVASVAFSPDSSKIISASNDKTAIIWDVSNGEQLAVLKNHIQFVTGAVYSPDGNTIVTVSLDGSAIVWDAKSYKQLNMLKGHLSGIRGIAFNPDGKNFVTAGNDKLVFVWDTGNNKYLRLFEHSNSLFSVAYSSDGSHFITGSSDGTAIVWDGSRYQQLFKLQNPGYTIRAVAANSNGTRFLTAGTDGRVLLWSGEGVLPTPTTPVPSTTLLSSPNASTTKGTLYFIGIAASNFANTLSQLQFTTSDASYLGGAFSRQGSIFNIGPDSIKYFIGEEAVLNKITAHLNKIKAIAKANDTVVLAIASHGIAQNNGEYHVVLNGGTFLINELRQNALSDKQIQDFVVNTQAAVLVLLDTCQAGVLTARDGSGEVSSNPQAFLAGFGQTGRGESGSSKIILTAASGFNRSYENRALGQGIFTQAILEALTSEAYVENSEVSRKKIKIGTENTLNSQQLAQYVLERVPALATALKLPPQQPTLKTLGTTPFIVADYSGR